MVAIRDLTTVVIVVDREHLPELKINLPTWVQHHPLLAECRYLLLYPIEQKDVGDDALAFLREAVPNAPVDTRYWKSLRLWDGNDKRLLSRDHALFQWLLAPEEIMTPTWIKIDTDTRCEPSPYLNSPHGSALQHLVSRCLAEFDYLAPSWGYTKHARTVLDLRTLWWGYAVSKVHSNGNQVDTLPDENLCHLQNAVNENPNQRWKHERTISWFAIHNTNYSRRVADGVRAGFDYTRERAELGHPVTVSHDTLYSLITPERRMAAIMPGVLGFRHPVRDDAGPREFKVVDHAYALAQLLGSHFAAPAISPVLELGTHVGDFYRSVRTLIDQRRRGQHPLMWHAVDLYDGEFSADYQATGDKMATASLWRRRGWRITAEAMYSASPEARLFAPMATTDYLCQRLLVENAGYNLIFVDAGHDYQSVASDLKLAWTKLNRGGWLCGHDYGHRRFHGVKQAVDEFVAEWRQAYPQLTMQGPIASVYCIQKP